MNPFNNVLVIEDNPGDARLVAAYLGERLGDRCEVRRATTLAEGLSALRQSAADVVLLDLGLPDSQGLDGYRELSRRSPATPVVILTDQDDDADALDALRMGAEDYLTKQSVDAAGLVRALRHAVQRRHITEQLRGSEARFRALVETAEEGILQLDREGAVSYLNGRAADLLGLAVLDPARLLGLRGWVAPGSQAQVEALLAAPVGGRVSHELQLLGQPDTETWVVAAASGIANLGGAPTEVVLLMTDISSRKRAEDELRRIGSTLETRVTQRTAQLEAANEELREIGRTMAHDLRTPLHGIIGLTQLLQAETQHLLPTTAWRRLQLVEASARDMNELITRLLATAALGGQALQRRRLDLSAMAREVADRLAAAEPQRQVSWRIQPDLAAFGDPVLIENALRNLLDNAWKFTSEVAAPVIELGRRPAAGSAPGWVYFIQDNGVGFAQGDTTSLFTAFRRLPSAQGFAGTGLGLAGVRRILTRHGGRIWAEHPPGRGARFCFTLDAEGQDA